MSHTLETLLPALAIADPAICLPCEGEVVKPGLPFLIRVDSLWVPLFSLEMPTASAIPALVEWAVKEAIAELDWYYEIVTTAGLNRRVILFGDWEPGHDNLFRDRLQFWHESPPGLGPKGDTIAIAAAYLKALGAEV